MKFLFFLTFFCVNTFAQEVLHFKAQYKIPVTRPELEDYSTFELIDYTVINSGKNSKIFYFLPFAMTGILNQKVELGLKIEKLHLKVFEGPTAIALCEGPWSSMKCTVRFKAIGIKYDEIENKLNNEGLPAQEIADRLSVIKAFGGEPIGETTII